MKLKETNHSYYCEALETNRLCKYKSWYDFNSEWDVETLDKDYNMLFRYDLEKYFDGKGKFDGNYMLKLFFIQQRHGRYKPVIINNIKESDIPDIEKWLFENWEYMKQMWKEFSTQEVERSE